MFTWSYLHDWVPPHNRSRNTVPSTFVIPHLRYAFHLHYCETKGYHVIRSASIVVTMSFITVNSNSLVQWHGWLYCSCWGYDGSTMWLFRVLDWWFRCHTTTGENEYHVFMPLPRCKCWDRNKSLWNSIWNLNRWLCECTPYLIVTFQEIIIQAWSSLPEVPCNIYGYSVFSSISSVEGKVILW